MGLIKEPRNVDFFVVDNPWTIKERKEFSELINKNKKKTGMQISIIEKKI